MQNEIMNQFNLAGKVAAITGAGGALCGNMAQALAKVGVKVALLDINREKAQEQAEMIHAVPQRGSFWRPANLTEKM
jgi:NAD(P)-dependent dehydrogenase (short-subunit alcohol dehydrogenase family)